MWAREGRKASSPLTPLVSNILREDWKPVLNLSSVMVGLQYLFLEPNPDDPLNKGASQAAQGKANAHRGRRGPPT